ncbi:hypothetical protein [Agrobacterium tumefaciens]|uniref:hypothetical protein n=1 Tax=Agrobacterium tumefaciens TaxID=358 RepID=UPI001574C81D|nr:hypothetical protein [Agrobacterium tumefaciens]NTE37680.1 hypothetical protein [Agrobacterium tumefaciens]NTE53143.1 hypothetical protein [Agrobacterium tumefaciens]
MTQAHQIFDVVELDDGPDPGQKEDCRVLYHAGGGYRFVVPEEAAKEGFIRAYFPSPGDALEAARQSTVRDGSFSVRPVRIRRDFAKSYLEWKILQGKGGVDQEALVAAVRDWYPKKCAEDNDLLAQMTAYALACHRAIQGSAAPRALGGL